MRTVEPSAWPADSRYNSREVTTVSTGAPTAIGASDQELGPGTEVGEYVVVHVGFALNTLDEAEARRVFEFLEGMNQLDELKDPSHEIPG